MNKKEQTLPGKPQNRKNQIKNTAKRMFGGIPSL